MLYSGNQAWSYLPNGYGKSNASSKKSNPCLVSRLSSSTSKWSTIDARQYWPSSMSPCLPW